jgi:hypothetical protein
VARSLVVARIYSTFRGRPLQVHDAVVGLKGASGPSAKPSPRRDLP